jgi:plastocyanin
LKHRVAFILFVCLAARAATAVPQGTTGTIKGQVHLMGKLPGNPVIRMGMDPKCSQMNAGKRVLQETVVATADGSLGNVFVRLQGNVPQTPVPAQPVVIDQRGCIYTPRVVGVRVGQTLQVKNSDDLLHNVDGLSGKTNGFNVAQPRLGQVNEFKPKNEEIMLHLKCDVHNWMNAYIGVVTNPYFAVSNPMGIYEIDKVPPGTYTVEAWHERFGTTSKTVTVKAGAVTTLDFSYTSEGTEKSSPSGRGPRK